VRCVLCAVCGVLPTGIDSGVPKYEFRRHTTALRDAYLSRTQQLRALDAADWKRLTLPAPVLAALKQALLDAASPSSATSPASASSSSTSATSKAGKAAADASADSGGKKAGEKKSEWRLVLCLFLFVWGWQLLNGVLWCVVLCCGVVWCVATTQRMTRRAGA
jgi:hypothetical protein